MKSTQEQMRSIVAKQNQAAQDFERAKQEFENEKADTTEALIELFDWRGAEVGTIWGKMKITARGVRVKDMTAQFAELERIFGKKREGDPPSTPGNVYFADSQCFAEAFLVWERVNKDGSHTKSAFYSTTNTLDAFIKQHCG